MKIAKLKSGRQSAAKCGELRDQGRREAQVGVNNAC